MSALADNMGGASAEGNTMNTIMARDTAIVAVVVACYLQGCATGAAPRDIRRGTVSPGDAVTVSNMTTLPVRIYLRRMSVEIALGTVQGLSTRTFDVDVRLLTDASELQLEARDRRGGVVLSDTFMFGTKRAAAWQFGPRSMQLDVR